MKSVPLTDTAPEVRQFLSAVPPTQMIRKRLEQRQREVTFLRRLLKLAVEAERSGKGASDA